MVAADVGPDALIELVGEDPRAALAAADEIVAAHPRPRDPGTVRMVATAHRAAGLAHRGLGDPVEAERRVRRALAVAERGGQPETAAEARMSLAFILLEAGRTRAALAATDHALSVLRGVRAARVRSVRALVLHRAGRTREAFAEYEAALRVLRRAKDEAWEARARHNRALLSIEMGSTDEARADLEWSREHSVRHGQVNDAADALFNIGVALEAAGHIPAALDLFDQADREWVAVERPQRWLARVDAYLGVGLVAEAIENATTAVAWLETRQWASLEAHARLSLATCLLASPEALPAARAEAARAREMFVVEGRREAQAMAEYVMLKAALLDDVSTVRLDDAAAVATSLRDAGGDAAAADIRITAGLAAIRLGDHRRARVLLGPLTALERSRPLDVSTRAWFARALLAELDGDTRLAQSSLRRAWSVVEQQRALLGATELRAAAATHAVALVEAGTRLAVASRSASSVFDWAERGRAAVLRYRPAVAPRDPELAGALARLRWAARTDEEAWLDGDGDRELSLSRARSEAEVVRITRRRSGTDGQEAPVPARTLRDNVDGVTFIEFVTADGGLWAVAVGTGAPALVPLGPLPPVLAAIETATFGLRRTLTGFGTGAGRAAAWSRFLDAVESLDSVLLAPMVDRLGDDELVVCPTSALSGVPWSCLPTAAGRAVRVAPSATAWCAARQRAGPASSEVVLVAGPALAGADREVADIARLYAGAATLTGGEATVEAVLDAAAGAGVLHLAAHGRLRTDNPLFSAIELADGPLTGYHLESLPRAPQAVVLSACSSGAGHATVADETLGLAWTLMGMGSATVVAPVLPVPDEATRDLMVALHARAARGDTISRALAGAQADTRGEDPAQSAVAAAFLAYGI